MTTHKAKYLLILFLFIKCLAAYAIQDTSSTQAIPSSTSQTIIPSPPNLNAKGYILMDANTGIILAGKNIDTRMPPASLTKLMTLYQIATALSDNRLHLEDRVPISEKAWRTGGSKMFVRIGDQVPLKDLIQGIAVVSGNDACVAVAEQIAGTEESFADLMNRSAAVLGMKNTHYTDATGLPDAQHFTSPRDLALLTRAIVNQFPQYYNWYSQKWFQYNGIRQPNRDLLLWRDPSIEGMKTGHTDEAGYCLVSTASRKNMRLISVVMGSTSSHVRADASLALLNYGFHFYESKKIFAANTPIKQSRIWFGKEKLVPIGVLNIVYVTFPVGQLNNMQITTTIDNFLKAPLKKGAIVGNATLNKNNKLYLSQPLVVLQDSPKGSFFSRIKDQVSYAFNKMLHKSSVN